MDSTPLCSPVAIGQPSGPQSPVADEAMRGGPHAGLTPKSLTPRTVARWRWTRHCLAALALTSWGAVGCSWNRSVTTVDPNNLRAPQEAEVVGQQFELPDASDSGSDDAASTPAPRSVSSAEPTDYWEMSLEEAIHYGLTNSKVLTDLGATVLRNPDSLQTNVTAAVTQTDPRFGIEGALSQFDTQLSFSSNFENNDRAINNLFSAGGISARTFKQDLNVYRAEMVKRGITGSTMAVRNVTEYDFNNAPANLFPGAWTTYFEGEVRQPLLQGAGVEFNRIAGVNGAPGLYNGVVVARLNADISQADFEIAMREYLSNVENAYWDLYFAYRDLDAKIAARDAALDTWRRLDAQAGKLPGSESFRLAQAREQYFKFEQDVQNALTGVAWKGRARTTAARGEPSGEAGVCTCRSAACGCSSASPRRTGESCGPRPNRRWCRWCMPGNHARPKRCRDAPNCTNNASA